MSQLEVRVPIVEFISIHLSGKFEFDSQVNKIDKKLDNSRNFSETDTIWKNEVSFCLG